jgi:Tfp pilus assembly pilus retraction ATPase PilT
MMYSLSALGEILIEEKAQGLHLYPGERPVVEVTRTLFRVSGPPLERGDTETLLRQIASADEIREFEGKGILSCYHHIPARALFHVMAFREHGLTRLEIRPVR